MAQIKFPGMVDRVNQRLTALGYYGERGGETRVMWGVFAGKHGYQLSLFGNWMRGQTPTYTNLVRLARDLQCELAWLLLGDDGRAPAGAPPIAGGSSAAAPLPDSREGAQTASYQTLAGWAAGWWRALERRLAPARAMLLVRA